MADNPKHAARHAAPAGKHASKHARRHGSARSEQEFQRIQEEGRTWQASHAARPAQAPQAAPGPQAPQAAGKVPVQQAAPQQQAARQQTASWQAAPQQAATQRPAGAQQAPAPSQQQAAPSQAQPGQQQPLASQGAVGFYQPKGAGAYGQRPAIQGAKPAWSASEERRKAARPSKAPLVLVICILLAIGAGAGYFWLHRPVRFTLDGNEVEMPIGSTLAQIKDAQDPGITAGNLLSVNGNMLQEGGGTQLSANVDGADLSEDDANAFRLKGGETITLSNGTDKTEDYDVQSHEDVQPKLKMEGDGGSIFYVKQWGKVGAQETVVGRQSGETYTGITQQPQDLIVERQGINPANDEKLVALTFDDGPSTYTDSYLDILDQYGIKATFCLIGKQVSEFSQQANRIKDDGCELATHTWDHKQLTKLSADEVSQELSQSIQAIKDVTGQDTTILRQPYGSMNADAWLASKGQISAAIFWTQDSEDWRKPGADAIVAHATANMAPGSIILMHDGGGDRSQDVEALPKIIEAWQNAGYRFVTISELMASDPSIPDEVCQQSDPMPDDAVWPTEISADSASDAIP